MSLLARAIRDQAIRGILSATRAHGNYNGSTFSVTLRYARLALGKA